MTSDRSRLVISEDRYYLDQVSDCLARAALPSIMAGIKLAAGTGLIPIAIFRDGCANDGIRFMIWHARQVSGGRRHACRLPVIAILGFVF
jgi:ABC-type nitrate/sulfonate/bicarbonate transport system permease component